MSSNIYLQICVSAALVLALANNNLLVQANPQFSVFNRQLFPSFSFPSFSRPSRPTFNSVQRPQQQRPSVFRPAPSPAPIVTRIVTTTVAPATTTTAETLIR